MNNDVIPECGGFLPVEIDSFGYILHLDGPRDGDVIHRECRDLHTSCECVNSFVTAKMKLPAESNGTVPAILELSCDGGGAAVWVRPEHQSDAESRLARFKGCYGAWPVRILSI